MRWGDCELIYNKEIKRWSPHHHEELLKYFDFFPESRGENIWLDTAVNHFFSAAQVLANPRCGQNHHFISNRKHFLDGEYPGASSWMGDHYSNLKNNFRERPEKYNTEARFGHCEEIDLLKEQESAMIIGGGLSSLQVDYSRFEDVPKWTMNAFYTNDKISSLPNIQLVTFLDSVNIEDPKLWKTINDIKPLLIQEISDLGNKRIQNVKSKYDKITYMHTRYRSRIGVGARLVIFAILLGIKKIYITGMDGYDLNSSETHAFEKEKKPPDWLLGMGPNIQKQNFVIFWDYIMHSLKKSYNFEIIDLSKGIDTVQYKFIQEEI